MTSWNFWRVCVLSSAAPHPAPFPADKSGRQATLLGVLTQTAKGALDSVHFVVLHKPDLHDNHRSPKFVLFLFISLSIWNDVFADESLSLCIYVISLKYSHFKVN
jgi:hypothetical protein